MLKRAPVAATTTIYKDTLVGWNADGYLAPMAHGTAGMVFAGVAIEKADNSAGQNGDVTCRYRRRGEFSLVGAGLAQSDVGSVAYAVDDQTITVDPSDTTNDYAVGRIVEVVSATEARVDIDEAALLAATLVTANLAAGIISADAAGRALFAAGVFDVATALSVFGANSIANAFLLDAIADGAFAADAATRALFAAGFVDTGLLAAGALSADAAGRAKIADGLFTSAEFAAGAGGKFAAGCLNEAALVNALAANGITNAVLIQAILDGAFQADAATRALFADRFLTYDKLALRTVEKHATDDELTAAESGSIHVGNKADGEVVITLPVATAGQEFWVYVGQAQETRIDPNGTETIALPSTKAQQAAGKYITADAVGEYVHLVCITAGTWDVLDYFGTWGVQG
ncbi:MAG TPA: hypothetical protein PLE61_15335 [Vicinamibacterales bacterium]|nr:hypothetical protein [Vicinamibacterales bacterium]